MLQKTTNVMVQMQNAVAFAAIICLWWAEKLLIYLTNFGLATPVAKRILMQKLITVYVHNLRSEPVSILL